MPDLVGAAERPFHSGATVAVRLRQPLEQASAVHQAQDEEVEAEHLGMLLRPLDVRHPPCEDANMLDLGVAVQSFVLAFSALFSIVNPIGAALIFSQVTAERSHQERITLARRIGLYAALVMLGALWLGSYVLEFFGVSLAALRIAGGLVVATRAWSLLSAPEHIEARKQEQAEGAEGAEDVAFFPLIMPFTTGPGTISVAIALGANPGLFNAFECGGG